MGKYIATTKCTISISPYVAANPTITCQKGYKVDGSEVYLSPMTLVYTGITDPSGNICPSMTITINGSSKKNKSKGLSVILENDNGKSVGTFTNSSSGATVTETVTATIVNAGQTKVKAE